MEELTNDQIIQNCIQFGECEIIEQEIIPSAMRTRINKAIYTWGGYKLTHSIEYMNPVNSNSIYEIKNERRELL